MDLLKTRDANNFERTRLNHKFTGSYKRCLILSGEGILSVNLHYEINKLEFQLSKFLNFFNPTNKYNAL